MGMSRGGVVMPREDRYPPPPDMGLKGGGYPPLDMEPGIPWDHMVGKRAIRILMECFLVLSKSIVGIFGKLQSTVTVT